MSRQVLVAAGNIGAWRRASAAAAIATVVGVVLGPALTSAQTAFRHGWGAAGVAQVGITAFERANAGAGWDHPALLGEATTITALVGVVHVSPALDLDQLGAAAAWPAIAPPPATLAQLAWAAPLPRWGGQRLGLGVQLQLPVAGATMLRAHDPRRPQAPLFEATVDRLLVGAGLGWAPLPRLRVGVHTALSADLGGLATFDFSVIDGRIYRQAITVSLVPQWEWAASAHYGSRDDPWEVAVIARQRSMVAFDLPLVAEVAELGTLQFRVAGVGLWSPPTLAVAARWQARPAWALLAQARWERWSLMPPLGPTVTLALDATGLPAPLPLASPQVPMAARDIVRLAAALRWRAAAAVVARLGVEARPSPLPRATGYAAYLDAPTAAVGAGLSWAVPGGLGLARGAAQLDLGASWTHLWRRTAYKRDPADAVVGTSLAGDEWRIGVAWRQTFGGPSD